MRQGRVEAEKAVIAKMIGIYCIGSGHGRSLCEECADLLEYANQRLDACRFGREKPFCSKCEVHCYKPEMREKVRRVMRYSGPRMFLHDPIMAFRHLLGSIK